ncbi:ribonucleotide-diphosphate reductase subunit beta [Deinococcus soli (ex Cha et al. 2016)]|uniref:ribonucleoside-diphosphate reductase n=2 Tax=Deinococcus soli (ex Cha et al. 2016) TaxID=1309411 RepID=A0AAE3XB66_9DEIO|nr:ribonucleotide-diphosphate reductase subunit beta [Deinococcus soli (ex Cha et al. 2016)]MDR6218247.1 ribonucleoside-diphosphate reductase beta chain [Deinococcus soli (ex Cha et al. 2016)]MDR6328987.1 ribonucleoside-diphosphate reductase beta chain [Deinococcus soli (ex Cha et al. 2016)]MDR6751260.1 ribonucleoside-diphosphate reductase beta chain [Deinococcus soli (ex Cha et al. 2016)]
MSIRAPFTATNWSEPEDTFSATFYQKYTSQLWFPDEIPLSNDALHWAGLSAEERWTYMHASAGLNALDTLQGEQGMPTLRALVPGHVRKATLQFQAMMEDVHARSYSLMNKTFLTQHEEREVFEWVRHQPHLQLKISVIQDVLGDPDVSRVGLWKKLVISCMLETALFYSGFFYPLYLAGQGRMVAAGEIFNLIILDEAVHGVYVAMLAQEQYQGMTDFERAYARAWFDDIQDRLYRNELAYTELLYGPVNLAADVKAFVRFNFNVLADNLALPRRFPDETIHPVVQNGIRTGGTTHDFFSAKGSSYQKLSVEAMTDDAFTLNWPAPETPHA